MHWARVLSTQIDYMRAVANMIFLAYSASRAFAR